ncbi:hypothetical protein D7I47_12180 [Protaetiibacter intestinalis]|uniref:Uncharacterized protein n=2 Tax=Protaetiibacter intestinalis TaxID=2419774 RepID=A0A387BCX1_9MICO|nr:hypothetical protein D7I47_12180 [Protaetiibacter intestinalis]
MVASALGLAVGNGLAAALAALLPDSPSAVLGGAALAGAVLGAAQAIAGAPLRAVAWIPLLAAGWTLAWGVSLALAIDAEQGFGIFGSTGSLLLAVALAVVLRLTAGTRIAAAPEASPETTAAA